MRGPARTGGLVALVALAAAGCGSASTTPGLPGASADRGHDAILRLGCGACHQIDGIEGADGHVGPSLVHFAKRQYIAGGRLATTPQSTVRWIMDPQRILPGTAMPDLGVGRGTAADITAYLYGQ